MLFGESSNSRRAMDKIISFWSSMLTSLPNLICLWSCCSSFSTFFVWISLLKINYALLNLCYIVDDKQYMCILLTGSSPKAFCLTGGELIMWRDEASSIFLEWVCMLLLDMHLLYCYLNSSCLSCFANSFWWYFWYARSESKLSTFSFSSFVFESFISNVFIILILGSGD